MSTPSDLLGLTDRLLDIDEARFRQVVGLLEHLGEHPDVQRTFSAIRPRLVELRPKRRPTWRRLFCEPFEDLFEAPLDGEPAPAPIPVLARRGAGKVPAHKIERAAVIRLWPLVEAQIGKDRLNGLSGALGGGEDQADQARVFWATAAGAVGLILQQAEAGGFAEELETRAHPGRIHTIRDIAHALAIAPASAELKAVLSPKPVSKLHPDHLDGVQAIGRTVARDHGHALPLFIRMAAARLADPSILLGGLWTMDLGQKPVDRAALFRDLSGAVVAQIEERSRSLAGPAAGPASRMAVADLAIELMSSLETTRAAMEQSRNKDFDQRLKAVRGSVHEMVRTQVLEGADTGILTAIDALSGSGGAGDFERMVEAENQARALRKCSTIVDTLGLRGELKEVTRKTTGRLADTARQMLGGGAAPDRARAGYSAIRMIELIAGSAEANQIMDGILKFGQD